jgi:hypothetical protein
MINQNQKDCLNDTITGNGIFSQKYDYFSSLEEQEQVDLFDYCLERLGLVSVKAKLIYCYRELLSNANKANLKRAFFKENGLNINNHDDYHSGLHKFKSEMLVNLQKYESLSKEFGYKLICRYETDNEYLTVTIYTNNSIADEEMLHIREKSQKIYHCENIDDAVKIIEEGEGAGLGLAITRHILTGLGMETNVVSYLSDEDGSSVIFRIPKNINSYITGGSEEFTADVYNISEHDGNIKRILNMIKN